MENDLENLNINEEVKYYNFPPPLRDIHHNENNNPNKNENKGMDRPKKIFSKKNNSNMKPQSRNEKNETNLLQNLESGLTSDDNVDHPKPLASDYYDDEKDDIRNSFIKMEKGEQIKEDNNLKSQLSKKKFEEDDKILDLKIAKKLENSFGKSQIDDKVNGNHIKSIEVKVNVSSNEPNSNLNNSQRKEKEKVNYIKKVKYDLKQDFPSNNNQISQKLNNQNKLPKEFVKNNNQQNNGVEKNAKKNEKVVIKKINNLVNNQNRIQNIIIDPEKKILNKNENKNISFHICQNKNINISDVNKNKSLTISNQQTNSNLKKMVFNNFNMNHNKNNSNIRNKVFTHKSIEKSENSSSYSRLKQNRLSNINETSSKRKSSCDEYSSNKIYQRISLNKNNILSNKQACIPPNVKDTYTFQHIPNITMNSLNYNNLTKSVPSIEFSNMVYSGIKDSKNLFPYESLKSSGNVKTQKYEKGGKFNNIQTTYVVYSKNESSGCNSNRNHYIDTSKSQNLKIDLQNIKDKSPIKISDDNNYYTNPNQNNNNYKTYNKNNISNDILYESYEYKSPYIQSQKHLSKLPYYQNKANRKINLLYLGESLNYSGVNERNTPDSIHRNYINNYVPSSKINNSSLYYKNKNKIRPMMMNMSNDCGDINYSYNSGFNFPINNNYISSFRYKY